MRGVDTQGWLGVCPGPGPTQAGLPRGAFQEDQGRGLQVKLLAGGLKGTNSKG